MRCFDVLSHGAVDIVCRGVTRMAKTSGCALSGFVLVKKVPGSLHFLAKSPGHSFDYAAMNMSHVVNYLYFGNKPSPRRHQVCKLPCASEISLPGSFRGSDAPLSSLTPSDALRWHRVKDLTQRLPASQGGGNGSRSENLPQVGGERYMVGCLSDNFQHIDLRLQPCTPVQALARLHPAGLGDDWADKLATQGFFSRAQKATFEHYMQVGDSLSVVAALSVEKTKHLPMHAHSHDGGLNSTRGVQDLSCVLHRRSANARLMQRETRPAVPVLKEVVIAWGLLLHFDEMDVGMQVVLTTIEPSKTRQDLSYDAYEYTVLSLPLLFQKTGAS